MKEITTGNTKLFTVESFFESLESYAKDITSALTEFQRLADKYPELVMIIRDEQAWARLHGQDGLDRSPYRLPDSPDRIVYFIQAGPKGPIKVGVTLNIDRRMASLQNGNAKKLRLLGTVSGGYADEHSIHEVLGAHRLEGEWFAPHPDVLQFIKAAIRESKR